jgi:centromere protein X
MTPLKARYRNFKACVVYQEVEVVAAAGATKKIRSTSANANALKLSCELLRLFVCEAVQRVAIIAEGEGLSTIEGTHLERILPQLLLDF